MADPRAFLRFRHGIAAWDGEVDGEKISMFRSAAMPDSGRVITLDQLTRAVHFARHEKADLWPVTPGCGCAEYAAFLWDRLAIERGPSS